MTTNALGEAQHALWKPKFHQAAFAQLVSSIALFTGHLDQGGFVTITTLILGIYTGASVTENAMLKPSVTVTEATKDRNAEGSQATMKVSHAEGSQT